MVKIEGKPWYKSKGVMGGLVAAAVGILRLMGYVLPEGFSEQVSGDLVGVVTAIVAAIAGGVAIYGRIKAVTRIGK